MTYSYMALRRLTLVLVINRAYRLVHRPISPIAGFRDFASYLRYSSKIEFALFHFSISAARRLYRQFSVVRQPIYSRDSCTASKRQLRWSDPYIVELARYRLRGLPRPPEGFHQLVTW